MNGEGGAAANESHTINFLRADIIIHHPIYFEDYVNHFALGSLFFLHLLLLPLIFLLLPVLSGLSLTVLLGFLSFPSPPSISHLNCFAEHFTIRSPVCGAWNVNVSPFIIINWIDRMTNISSFRKTLPQHQPTQLLTVAQDNLRTLLVGTLRRLKLKDHKLDKINPRKEEKLLKTEKY